MSYTVYNGAGSEDINCGTTNNIMGDNGAALFMGWWYPTTLTTGMGYWSNGNVHAMECGPTTSELRIIADAATTDGVWDTTGAGITVDKWWFIAAFVILENTTVPGQVRVWVGDIDNRPVALSISNTQPRSGNYSSAGSIYFGNVGTSASKAFEGDVGWLQVLSVTSASIANIFTTGTSGTCSATEEENIYSRLVEPWYLGRPPILSRHGSTGGGPITACLNMDAILPNAARAGAETSGNIEGTISINSAVWSERRAPISIDPQWWMRPEMSRVRR